MIHDNQGKSPPLSDMAPDDIGFSNKRGFLTVRE